jgi:hypothetical protein
MFLRASLRSSPLSRTALANINITKGSPKCDQLLWAVPPLATKNYARFTKDLPSGGIVCYSCLDRISIGQCHPTNPITLVTHTSKSNPSSNQCRNDVTSPIAMALYLLLLTEPTIRAAIRGFPSFDAANPTDTQIDNVAKWLTSAATGGTKEIRVTNLHGVLALYPFTFFVYTPYCLHNLRAHMNLSRAMLDEHKIELAFRPTNTTEANVYKRSLTTAARLHGVDAPSFSRTSNAVVSVSPNTFTINFAPRNRREPFFLLPLVYSLVSPNPTVSQLPLPPAVAY